MNEKKSVMQILQQALEPATDRHRRRELEAKAQRLDELSQVIRDHNSEMKEAGHD